MNRRLEENASDSQHLGQVAVDTQIVHMQAVPQNMAMISANNKDECGGEGCEYPVA